MSKEFREFTKMLTDNGYKRIRVNGSHYIFRDDNGRTISINKDPNRMVIRRIVRQNHLINCQ